MWSKSGLKWLFTAMIYIGVILAFGSILIYYHDFPNVRTDLIVIYSSIASLLILAGFVGFILISPKELIVMVVVGWIVGSIVSLNVYLPSLSGLTFLGQIGAIFGWMAVCFVPGAPLVALYKQIYKRYGKFRKFVDKLK